MDDQSVAFAQFIATASFRKNMRVARSGETALWQRVAAKLRKMKEKIKKQEAT